MNGIGNTFLFCNMLHLNMDFPAMVTSQIAFFVAQVSQLTVHLQNDEFNQSTEPRKNKRLSIESWLFKKRYPYFMVYISNPHITG